MIHVARAPTALGGDFVVGRPRSPLGDRVQLIWASRALWPLADERVLPDGSTILLLNFAGPVRAAHRFGVDTLARGMLATSASSWCTLSYDGVAHEQLGVLFAPGAAAAWFPEVACSARGPVPLDALGRPAAALWDALAHAPSLEDRVATAEAWLLALPPAEPPGRLTAGVLRLWSRDPGSSVAVIADRAGWTPQHLNRLLRRETGASAKELQQVVRLARVRDALRGPGDLGDLAHRLGFADQSHLHRFLRAHTGLRPSELREGSRASSGRVLYERGRG